MGNRPLNFEAGDSRELLGTRGPKNPCRTAGEYQVSLTCHFAITNVIIRWHGHQNAVQPLPFSPLHDALGLDPTINPMLHPILSKNGLSHHTVGRPVTAASHYDILFSHGQSVSVHHRSNSRPWRVVSRLR